LSDRPEHLITIPVSRVADSKRFVSDPDTFQVNKDTDNSFLFISDPDPVTEPFRIWPYVAIFFFFRENLKSRFTNTVLDFY